MNPYKNAATRYLQDNEWISTPLDAAKDALTYILTLRFLVTCAEWLVKILANVKEAVFTTMLAASKAAESLFIVATFYIVCDQFAHSLVIWLIGDKAMGVCEQASMVIFAALPELIVLDALKTSYERYRFARQTEKWEDRGWAIATAIPSVVFAVMMIIALSSFTDLESAGKAITQVTGLPLVIRIITGWVYAFVNGLYDRIGSNNYQNFVDQLKQQLINRDQTIDQRDQMIEQQDNTVLSLQQNNESLMNDLSLIRSQLHDVEHELLSMKSRKQSRKKQVIETETGQSPMVNEGTRNYSLPSQNGLPERVTESRISSLTGNDYSITPLMAAQLLNVQVRVVNQLMNNGVLKNAPNSKKITMKSIERYANKKGIELQSLNDTTDETEVSQDETIVDQEESAVDETVISNGYVPDTEPIHLDDFREMEI